MICPNTQTLDPRVKRTRKLLQDALRSLLSEKRFSVITVQDVTDRATVNRATFYAHYLDKEDLAVHVLKDDLISAVVKRLPEKARYCHENLIEFATAVMEFMAGLSGSCPDTARELQNAVGTAVQEAIFEFVDHWLTMSPEGMDLHPGCTKEAVLTVVSWSIFGGALRWSRTQHREPAKKIATQIVATFIPEHRSAPMLSR